MVPLSEGLFTASAYLHHLTGVNVTAFTGHKRIIDTILGSLLSYSSKYIYVMYCTIVRSHKPHGLIKLALCWSSLKMQFSACPIGFQA
jgi:hypothetical protein